MKIGIVVYSQTGNTMSAAQKILGRLAGKGHSAEIVAVPAEFRRSGGDLGVYPCEGDEKISAVHRAAK